MSTALFAHVSGSAGITALRSQANAASGATDIASLSAQGRKIRLLVFTSLYPNAQRPRHGVFVEERLRHLVGSGRVAATVVAPVPWFPFKHRRFGDYAAYARVPEREERHGISILHPRYPVIPKLGMGIAPSLMYHALLPALRKLIASGETFDLIDAHYFYPDGVAAVRLGMAMRKPVVITARGSDVNVIPQYRSPARQIRWAAERAASIVTVSDALKCRLKALGANPDKITVLRNGADLDRFRPLDRAAIRAQLRVTGSVWLAVGHLVELKGVRVAIEALARLPGVTLLVVGDGPEKNTLQQQTSRLGVGDRVRFLGFVDHDALCNYYNAADALVLASSREGMPNVVLESLACGTPVVATAVGGIPELIACSEAGELMRERTSEALVQAWQTLQARNIDRGLTRTFAETLGWQPVVEAQCALYARVLAARQTRTCVGAGP
ncbi:MAG: glycosyltransferase family 4 protein [Rhodanobacteraceae bacterium]